MSNAYAVRVREDTSYRTVLRTHSIVNARKRAEAERASIRARIEQAESLPRKVSAIYDWNVLIVPAQR